MGGAERVQARFLTMEEYEKSRQYNNLVNGERIFLKVNKTEEGVTIKLVDMRFPTPIYAQFVAESFEDYEMLKSWRGLFHIECTLGITVANIVKQYAVTN